MARNLYLLTVLTFLPLLERAGAAAAAHRTITSGFAASRWPRRVAEFAISLLLLRGFDPHDAGYQFEEFRNWIPQPPIHYHLGVDGISLFLVLLTTFLTPIAILCSWKSIRRAREGLLHRPAGARDRR